MAEVRTEIGEYLTPSPPAVPVPPVLDPATFYVGAPTDEVDAAQGVLPYQLEVETRTTYLTGLAGLPIYLDLAHVVGLREAITEHVRVRHGTQGWSDAQMVTALILLNLAGGK